MVEQTKGTSIGFVCWLVFSGCTLLGSPDDRSFAERDFATARDAYLQVLENRDDGRRVESALYHLGLIYLQPDPELYDPEAARSALTRLADIRPRSEYAAKASLLLALHLEMVRLGETIRTQLMLGREAEQMLASLREEATKTEAKSEDQSKKVGRLGYRIAGLQGQIVKLREELEDAATELAKREQELERLKRIDLEEPE